MGNFTLVSHNPSHFLCPYSIQNEDGYVFSDYTFYPQKDVTGYLDILQREVHCIEQREEKAWATLWDTNSAAFLHPRARRLLSRAYRLLGEECYNEAAGRICYKDGMRIVPIFRKNEKMIWNYFYLEGAIHEMVHEECSGAYRVQLFEDMRLRVMNRDGERVTGYPKIGNYKLAKRIIKELEESQNA